MSPTYRDDSCSPFVDKGVWKLVRTRHRVLMKERKKEHGYDYKEPMTIIRERRSSKSTQTKSQDHSLIHLHV